jgi:CRP/FNR family cyclic AMP-dependent transcriptional regulator
MDKVTNGTFNTDTYLATSGPGRSADHVMPRGIFYAQGGVADAIFYLRSGRAKLGVVSKRGKEATVTLLAAGDFFGEESMSAEECTHTSTASATTACEVMKISLGEMRRVLHDEHMFSDLFIRFIVMRGIRTQADLVDQLFNSSERRLARTLLLMADYGADGEPEALIPDVTQETLAEMIGTTRSRVSFFMNRFRKLGYIDYNGRIRVNRSLLNVVLHDELPEENASRPKLLGPTQTPARTSKRAKIV